MELIHIEGDYYIEGDDFSWTLKKKTDPDKAKGKRKRNEKKLDEERFVSIGHFTKLSHAFTRMVEIGLTDEKIKQLEDIINRLNEFEKLIEEKYGNFITSYYKNMHDRSSKPSVPKPKKNKLKRREKTNGNSLLRRRKSS